MRCHTTATQRRRVPPRFSIQFAATHRSLHLPSFLSQICSRSTHSAWREPSQPLSSNSICDKDNIHLWPLESWDLGCSDLPFLKRKTYERSENAVRMLISRVPLNRSTPLRQTWEYIPPHSRNISRVGARQVLNSVKLDGIAILKFQQRICKCQLSTLIVRVARGKFMHLH